MTYDLKRAKTSVSSVALDPALWHRHTLVGSLCISQVSETTQQQLYPSISEIYLYILHHIICTSILNAVNINNFADWKMAVSNYCMHLSISDFLKDKFLSCLVFHIEGKKIPGFFHYKLFFLQFNAYVFQSPFKGKFWHVKKCEKWSICKNFK